MNWALWDVAREGFRELLVSKIPEYILQRLRLLCFDKSTHVRESCQQVAVEIKTGLIAHIYPWKDHKNVLVILSLTIRLQMK